MSLRHIISVCTIHVVLLGFFLQQMPLDRRMSFRLFAQKLQEYWLFLSKEMCACRFESWRPSTAWQTKMRKSCFFCILLGVYFPAPKHWSHTRARAYTHTRIQWQSIDNSLGTGLCSARQLQRKGWRRDYRWRWRWRWHRCRITTS